MLQVLQRTYPGQLPPVKREIHNLVVPVDFSDAEDVGLVVEGLQSFVKRAIPIRFGLVPLVSSDAATEQARILYYLLDAYGLPSVLSYLETVRLYEPAIFKRRHGPDDSPSVSKTKTVQSQTSRVSTTQYVIGHCIRTKKQRACKKF